jgi:hypothetical protein
MAFEYLMAEYLLTGELKKLARDAGRMDSFAYSGIPRHIGEALLLGQKLQGLQFDLRGRNIQPETIERFQSFLDALARVDKSSPSGLAALAPEFGDTFWYYYYSRLAHGHRPTE